MKTDLINYNDLYYELKNLIKDKDNLVLFIKLVKDLLYLTTEKEDDWLLCQVEREVSSCLSVFSQMYCERRKFTEKELAKYFGYFNRKG